MPTKIGFISLGCDKNRVDSEIMLGYLAAAGYSITRDLEQAEIIIINTCGFIVPAKEESINAILSASLYKKEGRCRYLMVTGCLAQRYGQELLMEMDEIDGIMGTGSLSDIVSNLERLQVGERVNAIGEPGYLHAWSSPRILTTPGYTALIKIAEGCNNRCSYCAIPAIRGNYRSRKVEDIVMEARELCARGVRELVLVAQDTTRYGLDLYGKYALTDLLQELVQLEQCHWLRLLYCYPDAITDELLELMASSPKICRYLDLPLQHINTRLLRLMHRKVDQKEIEKLIARIRHTVPGVALRTTFIVGFPGETDQEFNELLDFMERVRFDRVGVFGYSPEEGTKAATLPGQIEEDVIADRVDRAMRLQQRISLANHQQLLGRELEVMVEGWDHDVNLYWGRTEADAPEIDGKVYFASRGEELRGGDFIQVRILDATEYDLSGVQI